MKLNPDYIRDVLLYLEENLVYEDTGDGSLEHKPITMHQIAENLHKEKNYDINDINYSIEKLIEARLITPGASATGKNKSILYCPITDITWGGHQFLNNIRSTTIWEATKSKAKEIGGISITGLSIIATSIIQGLASNTDFIQSIVNKMK